MAMNRLPPGFRFHPTDVELIMYYLKRKVMGRKLHYEAIAEVNIYKFSPWDLPDKSCLKSKDLEWYFFCPREKKYASGARVKRATDRGYWKTTGKDKAIKYNDETVGSVKTLVFHRGHAPHGERTDWVIHEYRILDKHLSAAGIQDKYVICKIFKKAGLGPMNGAQYGAPFDEEEWSDDDVDNFQSSALPVTSDAPSPSTLMQPEKQTCPLITGLSSPGGTSGLPSTEEGPSPTAGHPTSEVVVDDTDDEISRLLESFTDGDAFLFNENGTNQGDMNNRGKSKSLPWPPEFGIYHGLVNLDGWTQMNEGGFPYLEGKKASYFPENTLAQNDQAYIELNDFLTPLNCSTGALGSDFASVSEMIGSYTHDDVAKVHSGTSFAVNQYPSCSNQFPSLHEETQKGNDCWDMQQMANNEFPEGSDTAFDVGDMQWQPVHGVTLKCMERGTHIKIHMSRLMDSIPARTPSAAEHLILLFSTCGGSSMHIKAEVTHGAGECTNEALLFMMEGSGSCWCNLPLAVLQDVLLWFRNHLLYLVDFVCYLVLVHCYLYETLFALPSYFYLYPIEILFIIFLTSGLNGNLLAHFTIWLAFTVKVYTNELFK